MKRRIIALLVLALAVGVLSGGVTYMDSNGVTPGEFLQKLTGTSDTSAASEDIEAAENAEALSGEAEV